MVGSHGRHWHWARFHDTSGVTVPLMEECTYMHCRRMAAELRLSCADERLRHVEETLRRIEVRLTYIEER